MSATTAAAAAAGAAASSAASTAATTKTNQEASLNRQSYSDLDIDSDLAALSLNSDLITSVSLDGLALTKIVKHSRDSHPNNSSGTLLGLDIGGTLEVSNVFPLPNNLISGNEEEETGKIGRSAARYTQKMLQLLHDVNADDNPVGLYYGGFLGTFLSTPVVDQLAQIAGLMEREGSSGKGKGVLIVHDLAQSAQGNTVVRAYRLSPSFIEAHRKGKFNTQSLIDHKLTFATILVEIPVTLRNTALLDAFLSTLSTPSIPAQLIPPTTSSQLQNPPVSSIPSSNNSSLLTLAHTPILTSGLESVLDALDEHNSEAGNVGFQQRQMLREKARAEAYIQRKKAENLQREKEGKNPLPVEDAYRLFKVPDEPKRLESLLLLGKLDDSAAKLAEATATSAVKLHAARTGTA